MYITVTVFLFSNFFNLKFQTDPNWSNFMYNESTKTFNLIDFGAARDYPKTFVDDYLQMVFFHSLLVQNHLYASQNCEIA